MASEKEIFAKQGLMKVAVDAVVFTARNDDLQILLIKRKYDPFAGSYALPGGFVKEDEELDEAVLRELEEETGVKNISLHPLTVRGKVGRDSRGRVISLPYLALISGDVKLRPSTDAVGAKWFSIYSLPKLAFDHKDIIDDALKSLRFFIQTTNIASQILPSKFTLTQLQSLYELILERPLDKRNFRKKIKELDVLLETDELFREGAHRPAKLYKFKNKTFKPLQEQMRVFL